MNSEAKNTNDYDVALVDYPDMAMFRNNTGMYYNDYGVPICVGVAGKPHAKAETLGGSDKIGWTSVVVTPDMVGKRVAIFTAHELKSDKLSKTKSLAAQENFGARVILAGGYFGFVATPDDILRIRNGVGCTRLKDYPKEWL
jgi:hypothetical protein